MTKFFIMMPNGTVLMRRPNMQRDVKKCLGKVGAKKSIWKLIFKKDHFDKQ